MGFPAPERRRILSRPRDSWEGVRLCRDRCSDRVVQFLGAPLHLLAGAFPAVVRVLDVLQEAVDVCVVVRR